ncbi:hypothetical protein BJX63DRAFT_429063 [Aspergillus granulosus]|uniref:ABM domain-containing protein n=1 Tax=Aspergillus granulosus TaxID=176169 RepID=A0ABR4HUZ7_9EURO
MRLVTSLTALALAGSTLAQGLPRPGWNSPDPVTAVLTLTPKKGKTQQNVTTTESDANTKFLWFKVTGKDEFVVIEQYTNQRDLFGWVAGPEHTELIHGFLPVVDILKSRAQTDLKLF